MPVYDTSLSLRCTLECAVPGTPLVYLLFGVLDLRNSLYLLR